MSHQNDPPGGSSVPSLRVRLENGAPVQGDGDFVLYWMISARRLDSNFALQRAVEWSRGLGRPLVVLEALRIGYPWASDRLHRFALDGMADNAGRLRDSRVTHLAYVESEEGAGKGLLEVLARRAAVVVTDEFPCFFLPRMVRAAAGSLSVRLEVVDSNGLLPLAAVEKTYSAAYHFRRFLQKELPTHLEAFPDEHPLRGDPLPTFDEGSVRPPAENGVVEDRWSLGIPEDLSGLAIDHDVVPVPYAGGPRAGKERLEEFVANDLDRYGEEANDPDADVTSRLSPYLHWGHVSSHQIFEAVAAREEWTSDYLGDEADGTREGWWGMGESAEAFLDQLVTWRELGFVFNAQRNDYDEYESLPEWARETLEEHEDDERPHLYSLEEFRDARTHDPLWNAAQRQLKRDGWIHNYLRMLWGKKILEWSSTPREALEIMIRLNDRWAVDGRDPNSYNGIFWCLGRFDRGWPERPVFGKVRSMSSDSTRRKVSVTRYVERYGPADEESR